MFRQITKEELPIWIAVLQDADVDEVVKELKLIDDLLTLQASKSLMLRKIGLKKQMEARIMQDLDYNVHLDGRLNKYRFTKKVT